MAKQKQQGWWLWTLNPLALVLWPISLLFCGLVGFRRWLYQKSFLRSRRLPIPVIVVGNISVGGSGKTPMVAELTRLLRSRGHQPGILTRGYKSDHEQQIQLLASGEQKQQAGDEANLLSELSGCPLAVGADRYRAGRALLEQYPQLDCLVCDDGLQHYSLQRDIEIIVKRDAALGNRFCLPAGPLREPLSRLQQASVLVDRDGSEVSTRLGRCWQLFDRETTRPLDEFRGQSVNVLAGVAFPHSFFDALRETGLEIEAHPFEDHYSFSLGDIEPLLDRPLLVTHKDAVKLQSLLPVSEDLPDIWVVPLELALSDDLQYQLINQIESKLHG